MTRHLPDLTAAEFDLVIIGGGIFGACAARDAALRGMSVALLERHDFGGATSAHHLKMVHGGIRYLQHGDLPRLRQSVAERRAWLRTAPHLVKPLPIVVPTYGRGMKGRLALRVGMGLYDVLAFDRNRGIPDPARQIPSGTTLGRDAALQLFPGLPRDGLTGAGLFNDGQIHNPPRLVLAVLQSAVAAGAVVANYVEVTGFRRHGRRIAAVEARDALSGAPFEVRARQVLNAAGPYAERLLARTTAPINPPGTYSRDACFVVPRVLLDRRHALAVQGRTRDPDARLSRGARHLFVAPWREYTLIGVWHVVHRQDPDDFRVTDDELRTFIDEINGGYPDLRLKLEDVSLWNAGLVPFGENQPDATHLRYGHRSRLIDHAEKDGVDNLVTLIGVRFTTGRCEAERAIDLVVAKNGRHAPPPPTATAPVAGGGIPNLDAFFREAERSAPEVPVAVLRNLATNHGTGYRQVLKLAADDPALAQRVGDSLILRAQVRHAVRQEMAQTLADVAFRRTDLATGAYPGRRSIHELATLMAAELGWDTARVAREVEQVDARFPDWEVRRKDADRAAAR